MSGHVLVAVLPEEAVLYLAGVERVVAVSVLRKPMVRLVEAARAREGVWAALTDAVLYCPATERPGVRVTGGEVALFSSLGTLARAVGPGPWLASTGRDLLGGLPAGVGWTLDVGAPHAVSGVVPPRGGRRTGERRGNRVGWGGVEGGTA
ncbi:hypothetical protein LO762_22920 [Actinocorallia sp. API 0066]|uniref:hypothetical protein n=1 Tax=Actinocorallia sp. API 0066 TaxID=2896846 RepID=UPI001E49B94F|nr:hypothetical protein [Actinocorallia sp. API 0066]MCD0452022.1 hypothetical protein [Actinocorallia sp. API 0066]